MNVPRSIPLIAHWLLTPTVLLSCGRTQLDLYSTDSAPGGSSSRTCNSKTDCPTGEQCDPSLGRCVPIAGGCNTNADCGSPTPHCRLDTHTCVECVDSSACPSGDACADFECVSACGAGGACKQGQTCCGSVCVDTSRSTGNCGKCNNACVAHDKAIAACDSGTCVMGACVQGYADCDRNASNGCEVNLQSDPNNCNSCNQQCESGACSGGACVSGCVSGTECSGPNQQCCAGACSDQLTDDANCGGCGFVCGSVSRGFTDCIAANCEIVRCDAGYADCNDHVGDGCETNLRVDPLNCGTCGNACATDETCISGICVRYANTCKYTGCAGGLTCCGVLCIDTQNGDLGNCGGCGNTCPAGTTSCSFGACCTHDSCGARVCPSNRLSCNDECVDPATDPQNCGVCNFACPAGSNCNDGECTESCNGAGACSASQTCCSTGCADLTSDENHCGSCDVACSSGYTCRSGTCIASCNDGAACSSSQMCCATGCTGVTSDAKNCGSCNINCPTGSKCEKSKCTETCNGGPACTAGQTCCAAGCTTVTSDRNNCGACGRLCEANETCVDGECAPPAECNGGPACRAGQTCCENAGCVELQTDRSNCGACSTVCADTQACVGGVCAPDEGALNPVVNPTYLSPGVHHYSSINIPAGVQVYVAGEGTDSGTLDLQSDGPILINGSIDVSGGPGLKSVIASSSTRLGRAGAGGYTGEPYMSAATSISCAFVAGNPGQLGVGVQGSAGTCPILSATTCTQKTDFVAKLWTTPIAQYGGGAGVFTGFRAYGGGGGGIAGGAPGALCAPYPSQRDCAGVTGGGGAVNGNGGFSGLDVYDGSPGTTGSTECDGLFSVVPPACVGGGGGGGIGPAAVLDLGVFSTFRTGSGGGGGSADYLDRPAYGGTSGGGGGGGALRLASTSTITINGRLLANGGAGGDADIGTGLDTGCDPQPGAAGGGGSGGVIYLSAPAISVGPSAVISAIGGAGGIGSVFSTGGAGGSGGLGRIRLSVAPKTCELSGSFDPPLAAGCTQTNQPGAVYIDVFPN